MKKHKFTYGDKVRRKTGGAVLVVQEVGDMAYSFSDGTFGLIDDEDCFVLVEASTGYFEVADTLEKAPLNDHLKHGYETREEFVDALRRLLDRWSGRVGECVGDRNRFLHLRFHDTPGGVPDEAWLPIYLLTPVEQCDLIDEEEPPSELEMEVDRAFGFD